MQKEKFLEDKILLSKNIFDEIVDQIGNEVVVMKDELEEAVKEILGRYFEIKEN